MSVSSVKVAAPLAVVRPVAPAAPVQAQGAVKNTTAAVGGVVGGGVGALFGLSALLAASKVHPVLGVAAGLATAAAGVFVGVKGGKAVGNAVENLTRGEMPKPTGKQVAAGLGGAVVGGLGGAGCALLVGLNFVMGTAPMWAGPLSVALIAGGAVFGAAGMASMVGGKK